MAKRDQRAGVNPETAYEHSDWSLAAIGFLLPVLLAILIIAPLALRSGYPGAVSDADRRLLVEPPTPQLQIDPNDDLAKLRGDEEKRLSSYGWIDRQRGIVHIPIEAAMRKVAQTGIDGFPQAPQ